MPTDRPTLADRVFEEDRVTVELSYCEAVTAAAAIVDAEPETRTRSELEVLEALRGKFFAALGIAPG